jgi:hypothetical protein
MLTTTSSGAETFTPEERAAANEQLERLLANPFFSHSRRFPQFLRFIVEHTLSGHSDLLKERTIGIEVFGKDVDYDTSADPIVRVTAAEIRKRIALYYQEPGHADELRISLPPGSYIPQFHSSQEAGRSHAVAAIDVPHLAGEPAMAPPAPRRRHWPATLAGMVAGAALCMGALYIWKASVRSPVAAFWAPVLDSSDPVVFCIADQMEYTAIVLRDANDPARQVTLPDTLTAVIMDDLSPVIKFAGILQSNGKKYRVLGEGSTTLNDLRNGPDVFIGAYDNAWTLRLLRPLRFHFANNPEMTRLSIVDTSAHPAGPWVVDRTQQLATNIYRDYAIIARFTDSNTGRLTIVAAGIARGGTIAAGEFLSDPALLQQIEHIPGYNSKKNIELVLSTQIIGGQPGTPRIEASDSW